MANQSTQSSHEKIEKNIGLLVIGILLLISVGGLVQIVPLWYMRSVTEPVAGLSPYPPLELAGRDIYIRESCQACHSQLIRPFRAETERYGHYSVAGEFVYDRPFQFGSRRVGPDLARVGGRFSDEWHREHLINPRDLVPESIMPGYPWLDENPVDAETIEAKMRALQGLGHPYSEEDIAGARAALAGKTEMDALIAYLQSLGTVLTTER
jgi:cytochrome c oxidase cbb3-type subunit 2